MNNEYENDRVDGLGREPDGPKDRENGSAAAPFNNGETAGSQYHYSSAQEPEPWRANSASGYQAASDDQSTAYTRGEATTAYTSRPAGAPVPPKPHRSRAVTKKWGTRALALILVGAVAFGGGYAGTLVGRRANGTVVIQQAQAAIADSNTGTAGAQALSSSQVAQKVTPAVVAITTEKMVTSNTWFGGQQVESGAGSGVIISADGYILTCAHVISGADTIRVELSDGTQYDASVVGSYPDGDIAVIKIDATGLTAAVVGDSSAAKLGDVIYAVGNPEGILSGTITDGIISSLDRKITVQVEDSSASRQNSYYGFGYGSAAKTITLNCIQMSAQVSPGNSGGGLFNSNGELIGIVNAKSSSSNAEGLGFAIPTATAMDIATSLIEGGSYADPNAKTSGPLLGITAVYMTQAEAQQSGYTSAGVYVYSVTAKSTQQAGLASGDRIISVDDTVVSQLTDISGVLAEKKAGDQVSVAVERDGQMVTVQVTLVENSNT